MTRSRIDKAVDDLLGDTKRLLEIGRRAAAQHFVDQQRHVLLTTSGRADWSPLRHLYLRSETNEDLCVTALAVGSHHSPMHSHGSLVVDEDRSYPERLYQAHTMLAAPDSMGESAGLCTMVVAARLRTIRPDLVVVLGDRYEGIAVATAAVLTGIPLVHLHGGELTAGAVDDRLRHAISKLADVHLVATYSARDVLLQMGEPADSIHVIGAPGLEALRDWTPTPLDEVWARHGEEPMEFKPELPPGYLLVTMHPETATGADDFAFWEALDNLGMPVVVTGANQDGRYDRGVVANKVYVQRHRADGARFLYSQGQADYLDLMHHAAAVVGNSSSGIIEAPSVGTPSVDVGERQAGRIRADSVLWAPLDDADAIEDAIHRAVRMERGPYPNPYDPHHTNDAAARALEVLADLDLDNLGHMKPFVQREVKYRA